MDERVREASARFAEPFEKQAREEHEERLRQEQREAEDRRHNESLDEQRRANRITHAIAAVSALASLGTLLAVLLR
jgi:hypothetical protein